MSRSRVIPENNSTRTIGSSRVLTCCVTTKNAELCPRKRSPILSGTPPAACDAADARSPALIDEPLGRFLVPSSIRRSVPDFVGIPSLRCSSSPVHRQRAAAGVAGKKKGSSLRRSPHGLAVGTLSRNKLLRPPHTTHRGSPRARGTAARIVPLATRTDN